MCVKKIIFLYKILQSPSFKKLCFQVETTKVLLKENGVNLHLTVVDTPGFGDAVDNSEW